MARRHSPLTLAALAMSCYTSAPPPAVAPSAAPAAPLTIQAASVGPLTAKTRATLLGLRAAMPGFDVTPAHVMLGASTNRFGFVVSKDGDRLLHVVPDATGAIFTIHAVSSKVALDDRPWRIGGRFNGVKALTHCKCWEEEVVVCYKTGDHVAVAFSRECSYDSFASEDERQDLIGMPIHRVLWSPKPYTEDSDPYGGDEYGGSDYGG